MICAGIITASDMKNSQADVTEDPANLQTVIPGQNQLQDKVGYMI